MGTVARDTRHLPERRGARSQGEATRAKATCQAEGATRTGRAARDVLLTYLALPAWRSDRHDRQQLTSQTQRL